jgi:ribosome-binding factor A
MNQRLERVGQAIRDEISDILRREIHDPLIGFVTIMDVDVTPDLRFARVYYSVLGDAEQVQASTKGLLRARKYINGRLTDRLDLRYIPKLRFILDETAAQAQRLEQLLNEEQVRMGLVGSPATPVETDPTAVAAGDEPELVEDWEDDEDDWEDDELDGEPDALAAEDDEEDWEDEDDADPGTP